MIKVAKQHKVLNQEFKYLERDMEAPVYDRISYGNSHRIYMLIMNLRVNGLSGVLITFSSTITP